MERRILPIIGKSGFGKTYLTRTLLATEPRAIVVDVKGDYHGAKFSRGVPFWDFNAMADYAEKTPTFCIAWQGGQDYTDAICHLALALQNVAVVIEECDRIPCEGWFRESVYRGRDPDRVSIWALSQRPQIISTDLRSQVNELYAFNSTETGALDWLKSFFDRDIIAAIPGLPVKHGFHWVVGDGPVVVEPFRLP
jgi:hypothetical protein